MVIMLRPDEKFCIDAVVAAVGGKWTPGENPPDAYLSTGTDNIAVEISTLTQHVKNHNGALKSRLSEDAAVIRLCNELDEQLKNKIPAGQTVILLLSSPIKNARKLKLKLKDEIMSLVEIPSGRDGAVERKILGNTIVIHYLPEYRPSGRRIVGIVQNKKSTADILANAESILADRIAVKAQKCNSLVSRGPVWLALLNKYWIADIDTYRQAMAHIAIEHPFDKILIISRYKSVNVLYEK
ncbi:hypothetical protein D6779_10630 [Candidatus Parcubacteria bacterium]|nr:MAG: hypothetical protein D6779_10630 [Candidatus Parcubacteria bacterium]